MVRLTGVEPVACRLGGRKPLQLRPFFQAMPFEDSGERRAKSLYCLPLYSVR